MRVGIFGGTFDPPHLGHLILAERCRDEAELEEVWFLPSYVPPHKAERALTRFEHRCEMVSLAVMGQVAFRVEPIEKELPPPSYTVETLAELSARHPQHQFSLIIGGDSLNELHTWCQPQRLISQAELIAVARPGSPMLTATDLAARLNVAPDQIRLKIVSSPQIDIASREIRERMNAGRSIRYLLPRSVEEFVRERKLYRS